MPVPTKVTVPKTLWVVLTLLGPHYSSADKQEAKAAQSELIKQEHVAILRKYHIGKEVKHGDQEL